MRMGLLGVYELAAIALGGLGGVILAWLIRRRSTLSARNLYLPAIIGLAATGEALASGRIVLAAILAPLSAPALAGSLAGRRWRLHDLGAGEELRQHELTRRWLWQPPPARQPGERVYIASQGELVHRRPWAARVPRIAMGTDDDERFSLPLGQGQHVFLAGATGSGKTTTARRLLAARTLEEHAALLVLDQKGDQHDVEQLRRLAAAAAAPFVLIDPLDPESDRYQPLWGAPAQVAARAVEPIKASEPYYYDMLRLHLDVVCRLLEAGDLWPPSVPLLVEAAHPAQYPALLQIAEHLDGRHATLKRRARQHAGWVNSAKGREALDGGAGRLEVALALATREIVTPRVAADGEAVAVGLTEALAQRAVVMWRLHADVMPDEAAAMSVLVLADLHDAAGRACVPWTLLLDEFGAVIQIAAMRATAILQRGRTHGGQVVVATQSVMDAEALTQQSGLLASLTDNFSGVVAHRQIAPESRDWLAKLMGTRALWQSTNQTSGHGAQHSGQGSSRRVREFRIGSDVFAELEQGEAVIYTTHGPDPKRGRVAITELPPAEPARIGAGRHACELLVHPADTLEGRPAVHQGPIVGRIDPDS
jgi:energy-coupling factor transporter ATP-binding protein EcfA2